MAKKTTKKEQKQNKQFVEKLLMLQGIKYDDWLDQLHLNYIQENNSVILNALETTLNKQQENTEVSNHNLPSNENEENEENEETSMYSSKHNE